MFVHVVIRLVSKSDTDNDSVIIRVKLMRYERRGGGKKAHCTLWQQLQVLCDRQVGDQDIAEEPCLSLSVHDAHAELVAAGWDVRHESSDLFDPPACEAESDADHEDAHDA